MLAQSMLGQPTPKNQMKLSVKMGCTKMKKKKKKKKAGCVFIFFRYFPSTNGKIQVCSSGGVEGGLFEQMTLPLLTWPDSNAACQDTHHPTS